MQELQQEGKVTLSPEILIPLQEVVTQSVSVDDRDIIRTLQFCQSQYQYALCPHTATAVSYVLKQR